MSYNWAKGTDGKAIFGTTTLSLTGWTYGEAGDDADVTHSGSSGVKLTLDITKEYKGTIEGIYDLDLQPTDSPPDLIRGSTGTLKLYVDSTKYISVPARILTLDVTDKVNDTIRWSASYVATAAPTYAS